MGRIRDLNRYRKTYPFSRARRVAPETRLPFRDITTGAAWAITADGDDYIISVNATAAGTITMPIGSSVTPGDTWIIKDAGGNAGTYAITIAAASGDQIDGSDTHVLAVNYATAVMIWTGTSWGVF